MGHQRQLVRGVEAATRSPTVQRACEQRAQPAVREHPLDEVLAQPRIARRPSSSTGSVGRRAISASAKRPRPARSPGPSAARRPSRAPCRSSASPSSARSRSDARRASALGLARRRSCAAVAVTSAPVFGDDQRHRLRRDPLAPSSRAMRRRQHQAHRHRAACRSRLPPPDRPAPTRRGGRTSRPGTDRACGRRRSGPAVRAGTPKCRCAGGRRSRDHSIIGSPGVNEAPVAGGCMARNQQNKPVATSSEGFSEAVTKWTGSTTAFACALGVIVRLGAARSDLRLLRHLAARHQHRHDHRHLPDGVPDSAIAEQGRARDPPEAERAGRGDEGRQQPADRRRGRCRRRICGCWRRTTASWRRWPARRPTSPSRTRSKKPAQPPSRCKIEALAGECDRIS